MIMFQNDIFRAQTTLCFAAQLQASEAQEESPHSPWNLLLDGILTERGEKQVIKKRALLAPSVHTPSLVWH